MVVDGRAQCTNGDGRNLEKKIPGAPENEVPVHLRKKQIYAHSRIGELCLSLRERCHADMSRI